MAISARLRIIIVEDDPRVLLDTRQQVETIPNCIVLGTCNSISEAFTVIPALQPDILLLDIHLGDGNAFDLLAQLPSIDYKVIFLTAYEEHAIKAIKYGALDYLLKPVNPKELVAALDKAVAAAAAAADQFSVAGDQLRQSSLQRIVIPSQQYLQYILVSEILYCQGDAGYTTFFLTDNKKWVAAKYIKEYEELLPPDSFLRVHQSYLVNTHFIEKYHKGGWLVLKNGAEVPVSVRRREYVKSFLAGKQ